MDVKQRMLDKAVLGLFGPDAFASTFLTTIYCSLRFKWTDAIPTACTNGLMLMINFDWFETLSEKMRVTLLAHELWHIAYMHMFRQGDRDPKIFNMACDYAINLMLYDHGYHFDKYPPGHIKAGQYIGLLDAQYANMSAEEIYELLIQGSTTIDLPFGSDFSKEDPTEDSLEKEQLSVEDQHEIMAVVLRAKIMSDVSSKEAGLLPGDFVTMIDELLRPRIDWKTLLDRWLTEKSDESSTWSRPNRRHQDIYLPSKSGQEGLARLLWAIDCSGSLSDNQLKVINGVLWDAKHKYNPESMWIVSFDEYIRDRWEFTSDQDLIGLEFLGRGGTDMTEVFELAQKVQPEGLIMLSDMDCPIPEKPRGVEVLWICMDSPHWVPPYGKVLHVDSSRDL